MNAQSENTNVIFGSYDHLHKLDVNRSLLYATLKPRFFQVLGSVLHIQALLLIVKFFLVNSLHI